MKIFFLPIVKTRPHYEEAFLPIAKKRPHYEQAFLPIDKKRPRLFRFLGLASLLACYICILLSFFPSVIRKCLKGASTTKA